MTQNDFYIIAPSNACTNIFPQNRANNYTIAWENPIELNPSDEWCVALTEANCELCYRSKSLLTHLMTLGVHPS